MTPETISDTGLVSSLRILADEWDTVSRTDVRRLHETHKTG